MSKKSSQTSRDFSNKVLEVVSKIRKGETLSYGEVARRAGNAKAARAVGSIMRANEDKENVPCHRVIRKDGSIGGYNAGIAEKLRLLRSEGVKI